MTHLPGAWIAGMNAMRCGGCGGIFDGRDGVCPKADSGENGFAPVNNTRAKVEIDRLRGELVIAIAALMQIAHGLHDQKFKARVATKALEQIKTGTAPVVASAVQTKGVN